MDLSVTHCNARTDFEFIEHLFDPDGCDECVRILQISGTVETARRAIDALNRSTAARAARLAR